jgi:hypothetical protein
VLAWGKAKAGEIGRTAQPCWNQKVYQPAMTTTTYGSINKTVPTTALMFAWGISVQALSQNAPCKHQKTVQVSEDPTLSTRQQTDGEIFSMMTINDNNIAQHTRRSKRRKCRSWS